MLGIVKNTFYRILPCIKICGAIKGVGGEVPALNGPLRHSFEVKMSS
jgi:hypothetical protein